MTYELTTPLIVLVSIQCFKTSVKLAITQMTIKCYTVTITIIARFTTIRASAIQSSTQLGSPILASTSSSKARFSWRWSAWSSKKFGKGQSMRTPTQFQTRSTRSKSTRSSTFLCMITHLRTLTPSTDWKTMTIAQSIRSCRTAGFEKMSLLPRTTMDGSLAISFP